MPDQPLPDNLALGLPEGRPSDYRLLELRLAGQIQPQQLIAERVERSRLSDEDKTDLHRFLIHFPDLDYIVTSAHDLRRAMTGREVELPRWLIDLKAIFNGFGAFRRSRFMLHGYSTARGRSMHRYQRTPQVVYEGLGQAFYIADEEELLSTPRYRYCAIAREHHGPSLLVINLRNPDDHSIYELNMRNLLHDWRLGGAGFVETLPVRVFDSYAELLANISRIIFEDEVIEARQ
ncbi:hypothetical protein [Deinococcus sp.]|uniref:hypothetical protein n=1 Tax=Deinococcus sp. TaxID=47478 RepID=UPI0025CDE130|nr:hypothetical protein [Deinococcus sp.]